MKMKRLREPGHAQFLLFLFVVLHFSPLPGILLKKKWFEVFFFFPITNLQSYSYVVPKEWMKTTKEARIVSWGKPGCKLLLSCAVWLCSILTEVTVAEVLCLVLILPAFTQTHCIVAERRLWGEKDRGVISDLKRKDRKGQYITPQDYKSLWLHVYFLISPESDEGRSRP